MTRKTSWCTRTQNTPSEHPSKHDTTNDTNRDRDRDRERDRDRITLADALTDFAHELNPHTHTREQLERQGEHANNRERVPALAYEHKPEHEHGIHATTTRIQDTNTASDDQPDDTERDHQVRAIKHVYKHAHENEWVDGEVTVIHDHVPDDPDAENANTVNGYVHATVNTLAGTNSSEYDTYTPVTTSETLPRNVFEQRARAAVAFLRVHANPVHENLNNEENNATSNVNAQTRLTQY